MAENLPTRPPQKLAPSGPAPVPEPPPPPDHLGEESSQHWRDAVEGWVLGADAIPVLHQACDAWDRIAAAKEELAQDGLVITHPSTGAKTTHPAWPILRDSLREWRQLWRQLGLAPPEAP